ncbi:MAG: hypothetical protein WCL06_13375 [Bacteroidota bacterium]
MSKIEKIKKHLEKLFTEKNKLAQVIIDSFIEITEIEDEEKKLTKQMEKEIKIELRDRKLDKILKK